MLMHTYSVQTYVFYPCFTRFKWSSDFDRRLYNVYIQKLQQIDSFFSSLFFAAAVMDLYSKGTFGKDALQWTKCVVKYLHDNYADQVLI